MSQYFVNNIPQKLEQIGFMQVPFYLQFISRVVLLFIDVSCRQGKTSSWSLFCGLWLQLKIGAFMRKRSNWSLYIQVNCRERFHMALALGKYHANKGERLHSGMMFLAIFSTELSIIQRYHIPKLASGNNSSQVVMLGFL